MNSSQLMNFQSFEDSRGKSALRRDTKPTKGRGMIRRKIKHMYKYVYTDRYRSKNQNKTIQFSIHEIREILYGQ